MKLISWNVNGIRAVHKKGLVDFLKRQEPHVVCFQETKCQKGQLGPEFHEMLGYNTYWACATRKGYSGVATFARVEPKDVEYGIGIEKYDSEGRIVVTRHPQFLLYNIYFPNGGSGPERHQFKQDFLRDIRAHLKKKLSEGEQIVVVGDYNVAFQDIDVYDPIGLSNESGFLPEEREWFAGFLDIGFVDTFRHLHPDVTDRYTWWDYRKLARIGNRGWRIDYICVSQGLADKVVHADILDHIEGSDHCPVLVEIKE
ncbi:MAG TPA: exodeoxyribonuclease III [Bdellovibrionales bacterium]|nr:exodeoxyribonuclease III [Bdellovibrionales bacterium]